jgi:hypothetical protein
MHHEEHDRPRRRYVVKRGPAPARLRHLPPIDEVRESGDDHGAPETPGAPWRRHYWIIERRGLYGGPWRHYYVASEDAPMDERSNRLFVHLAVGVLVVGVALLVLALLGH